MKGLTYIAGVILGVVAFVTAVSVFVWHWTLPDEDLVVADASSAAGHQLDESRTSEFGGRRIAEFRATKSPTIVTTKNVVQEEEDGSAEGTANLADSEMMDDEEGNVMDGEPATALGEWDVIVDEIGLLSDRAVTREDQVRINQALKRVPPERRRESVQALLNMVNDDNFVIVHDLLLDRSQSPDVVQAVYHDLLNRPDEVKTPLLKEIAQDATHANALEARQILKLQ